MNIRRIAVGDMLANAFIVYQKEGGAAALIDAGDEAGRLLKELQSYGLTLTHILLTHGHFDHIGAVAELARETGAKIAIHRLDAGMLTDPAQNLSYMVGRRCVQQAADLLLEDGDRLEAGGLTFTVLHTPGHSPGSVCYLCGDAMFSGDTLFHRNVGRIDFPGSDGGQLSSSLNRLKALQPNYAVHSGHGISTALHEEIRHNPYLNGSFSL